MEAFYAVLPVFLLIAVGAAVHMTDVLPENTGAAMGLYVLKLALPVLMLHILSGASRLDLAHGGFWLGVIGAQMLCYLLGYAVDRLFSRRGTGPAIISGLACSASNTAFVGLPIVAGLLPGNHEAMVVAGLAALTPNVVVIMAQIRMDCLAGSAAWGDGRGRIWKLLRLFLLVKQFFVLHKIPPSHRVNTLPHKSVEVNMCHISTLLHCRQPQKKKIFPACRSRPAASASFRRSPVLYNCEKWCG